MGQDRQKCKETPLSEWMSSILDFLVLMYLYGSLGVPLVPKSHDTLLELFKFTRYVEGTKVHFAPFLRFHWNHYIGFLTSLTVSKIVTSTKKTGGPSEETKFYWDPKEFFWFSTCPTVLRCLSARGRDVWSSISKISMKSLTSLTVWLLRKKRLDLQKK